MEKGIMIKYSEYFLCGFWIDGIECERYFWGIRKILIRSSRGYWEIVGNFFECDIV